MARREPPGEVLIRQYQPDRERMKRALQLVLEAGRARKAREDAERADQEPRDKGREAS